MTETPESREQLARYLSEAQSYEKKQRQRREMEATWREKIPPPPGALAPRGEG